MPKNEDSEYPCIHFNNKTKMFEVLTSKDKIHAEYDRYESAFDGYEKLLTPSSKYV